MAERKIILDEESSSAAVVKMIEIWTSLVARAARLIMDQGVDNIESDELGKMMRRIRSIESIGIRLNVDNTMTKLWEMVTELDGESDE